MVEKLCGGKLLQYHSLGTSQERALKMAENSNCAEGINLI